MPNERIDALASFMFYFGDEYPKPSRILHSLRADDPAREMIIRRQFSVNEICRSFAVPPAMMKPQPVITLRAIAFALDEARIIADCFRIMCPGQKVRVIETAYLTEYEVQAYNDAT